MKPNSSYFAVILWGGMLLFSSCNGSVDHVVHARSDAAVAEVAESSASARDVHSLVGLMSGEFDSFRQMQADITARIAGDNKHGRVNRYFTKIDAPDVGESVLVGSTRYSGPPDWYFDRTEFLVWSFQVTDDGQNIKMSPHRFKNLESKIQYARQADKLIGIQPDDLEAAVSGAACDIIWTPIETGFEGRSLPCKVLSTTQGVELNWNWHYQITPQALWVEFSGETDAGDVLFSTPKGSPYRLDKINSGSAG